MDIQLLIQNCVHNRIKFFLKAGDFLPQHGRKKDQLSLLENKYSNKVPCAASQYIMKVSKYMYVWVLEKTLLIASISIILKLLENLTQSRFFLFFFKGIIFKKFEQNRNFYYEEKNKIIPNDKLINFPTCSFFIAFRIYTFF